MTDTRIRLLSTSGITTACPQLPDGVYLNLPEAPYFAQEKRLGSTDMCDLYLRAEGWQWKVRDATPSLSYGRALHKGVLEGMRALNSSIFITPDKDVLKAQLGERFCVTVGDMVAALEKRGMHPKANQSKEWFITYCAQRAPDLVIWEKVQAEAKEAGKGKILVTEAERAEIVMLADLVHNHADIGHLFQYDEANIPLAEVTVLYTDEHGLRRRVRFDLLLPQQTIDMKSLFNVGGRQLKFYAGEVVAQYALHVQMADHQVGRRWMLRLIEAGKVYDGTPEDLQSGESQRLFQEQHAWLRRFPAEAANADYAWIFYQRPDAKNGQAPIVFPWGEDLGSDLHRRGIRCRRQAIGTYRRCMEQFGPDQPWVRVEPLHSSVEGSRMPKVIVPHWIGGDEQLPDEDDDL